MSSLDLKPKESCAYDILSLGEVMLRLDPGEGRIRTTRQFRVWEGGGEYNVARGLRRCFGQRAAGGGRAGGVTILGTEPERFAARRAADGSERD